MKSLLLWVTIIGVTAGFSWAQSGPGGIGNSTNNVLWLKADSETGYSNGNKVSPFTDRSGNAHDYTVGNNNKKPNYTTEAINSLPALTFDGADDALTHQQIENYFNGMTGFTIFSVTKSNSTGVDHGFFDTEVPETSDDLTGIRYDAAGAAGGTNVVRFNLGTTSGSTYYESADNVQSTSAQLLTFDWAASDTIRMYNASVLDTPNAAGLALSGTVDGTKEGYIGRGPVDNTSAWDGWIAEFIVYNERLNDAQRLVVENYLSSKYNLDIGSNDFYTYEASHSTAVSGIGRIDASNIVSSATSAQLSISNANALSNRDFLFVAHNNSGVATFTANDVPNIGVKRVARTWRVGETGDVGTVTISVDTTDFANPSPAFPVWVLLVDDDGDFSAGGTTVHILTYNSGSEYSADDIELSDGDYITVGIAFNYALGVGNFSDAGVWLLGTPPAKGQEALLTAGSIVTLDGTDTIGSLNVALGATFNLGSGTLVLDNGSISGNGNFNIGTGKLKFIGDSDLMVPNYAYNGLELGGAGTKTLQTTLNVGGDFDITGGTVDVGASNHGINVSGHWNNSGGSFNARNGTVTMNGTAAQQITANGSAFYNLAVNNSHANGISLNDDVRVDNTATLTDGIINTGSNRMHINNSAANALSGYSNASFVNGNLRRNVANNTDTYAFPVGNGTTTANYFLAELDNKNLNGITYIDASFDPLTNHNDAEMSLSDVWLTYTSVNTTGIWTIEPDAQPVTGEYDVRLYIDNFTGLEDNNYAILKRPVGSISGDDWSTGGGILNSAGDEGRTLADGYMIRYSLTSFSEFGAGSGSKGLPIELISFTAENEEGRVKLEWATATEINNEFFTIERSVNGTDFELIATMPGAGNSSRTLYYSTYDEQPVEGTAYYRLKQTDYDGSFEYSPIVAVEVAPTFQPAINVFPNPVVDGAIAIHINGVQHSSGPTNTSVKVLDINGTEVWSETIELEEGNNRVKILPAQGLNAGIYIVQITSGTQVYQTKLMVN